MTSPDYQRGLLDGRQKEREQRSTITSYIHLMKARRADYRRRIYEIEENNGWQNNTQLSNEHGVYTHLIEFATEIIGDLGTLKAQMKNAI